MGLAAHGHAQLDAATGAYRRHRPEETVRALERKVPMHAGTHPAISPALAEAIRGYSLDLTTL
jgi:hypothetical protein